MLYYTAFSVHSIAEVNDIVAELNRLYTMISDYDFIDLQYENYGTLKKLQIEKRYHDHDVRAFEVVSNNNNGLQLRTVYYTKNNEKGSQADRTATSKSSHVAGTTSPTNNITKDSEKSNTGYTIRHFQSIV